MKWFLFILIILLLLVGCGQGTTKEKEQTESFKTISDNSEKQVEDLTIEDCEEIDTIEEREACLVLATVSRGDYSLCETFITLNAKDACIMAGMVEDQTLVTIDLCEEVNDEDLRNTCVMVVAKNEKDASVCEKATKEYKDLCYQAMAGFLNDKELCKKIQTKRIKLECDPTLENFNIITAATEEDFELTPCPIYEGTIKQEIQNTHQFGFEYKLPTGHLIGPRQYYYDKELSQPKQFLCYNQDGKKIGMDVRWTEFIFMESITEYKNGLKDGYEIFFQDGYVKTAHTWTNGEKTGPSETYYTTGQRTLQREGNYLNGQQHSTWKSYDKEGTLIATSEFD